MMDILVVLEDKNGNIHRMSQEAITGAQQIGSEFNLSVGILAMGSNAAALSEQAAQYDVEEVLTLENEHLNHYTADGYGAAVAQVVTNENPKYVFFGYTYQVRDYVPRVSAKLKRPFLNDAVSYSTEGGNPVFSKQVLNAKLVTALQPNDGGPILISFQSAAFSSENIQSGSANVRTISVDIDAAVIKTVTEDPFQEEAGGVDLSSAELIVSIGRGIGKEENIPLAQELAKVIGAELASSRPVVDSGWLAPHHQIGSSGQTVAPKLYLALGISGAIQHVVGMKGSKNIVVVNKDPDAPLFELADYGVVGDVLEIIPKLTEALK
ncbi:MAG: electron transfer flavoprotein subunit alpha/FixB family protein [Candidatus Marinimicrobia bacterium]|jgi:electron transfer flavoprotein alpha subunit|nr:electron transfer flavoprotein subunit alpha [Candidatus Neomarinimicrobiota bacterium]MDP6500665.1 electron transfer flavoprotein subunit alpha/FixB family protein [Candidatus Neomarinimicrobiota bacterium]MDP6726681.1 electron transfer flavoprotein subunit alpha/FixB family protein [Candidatus Neomarinimicrobiota bacterium]|tara:strand:- start:20156 stop:21124 length:969 start_codon:yes stop_codon:yes gene_type:complete